MALPKIDFSDSNIAAAFERRANEVSAMMRTAVSELTRRRQTTMGEVIPRVGLSTMEALQSQAIRCIFGLSSSGDEEGCAEPATFTCQVCNAICCDFHQEHNLHEAYASETSLFRQQQAIAQQRITAPAVASAKDTRDGAAARDATKKPRKNTWSDLLQRYERINGKAYEKPAGQKVGDFQLMVEGLEGRLAAAGAKTATGPTTVAAITSIIPTVPEAGAGSALFEEFRQYQAFVALRNSTSQPPADSKESASRNKRGADSDHDDDEEDFL